MKLLLLNIRSEPIKSIQSTDTIPIDQMRVFFSRDCFVSIDCDVAFGQFSIDGFVVHWTEHGGVVHSAEYGGVVHWTEFGGVVHWTESGGVVHWTEYLGVVHRELDVPQWGGVRD